MISLVRKLRYEVKTDVSNTLVENSSKRKFFFENVKKLADKTFCFTSKVSEGEITMRLLELFYNHAHYWGVPHPRSTDDRLIQTCYECGAEREVKAQLYQSNTGKVVAPYQGDKYAA